MPCKHDNVSSGKINRSVRILLNLDESSLRMACKSCHVGGNDASHRACVISLFVCLVCMYEIAVRLNLMHLHQLFVASQHRRENEALSIH